MLTDKFDLLTAQTSNGTTSTVYTIEGWDRVTGCVEWSAGAAAGTVVIESAYTQSYAGTWNPMMTFNWSAASSVSFDTADVAGLFVRARITSAITSGTVDVHLVRQKIGVY